MNINQLEKKNGVGKRVRVFVAATLHTTILKLCIVS